MPPNKLAIEIEAALAFGTGHHGTTRGCLLLLDHVLKSTRPRRVLDLGTGTGVLAIAAAKALHRAVLASDIDPPSVRVAAREARLNGSVNCAGDPRHRLRRAGIWQTRSVRPGAGEHPGQSVAAIGDARWRGIWRHRRAGHPSGLLPHQANGVIAAYRARGLVLLRHLRIEGWSSLLLRKL